MVLASEDIATVPLQFGYVQQPQNGPYLPDLCIVGPPQWGHFGEISFNLASASYLRWSMACSVRTCRTDSGVSAKSFPLERRRYSSSLMNVSEVTPTLRFPPKPNVVCSAMDTFTNLSALRATTVSIASWLP